MGYNITWCKLKGLSYLFVIQRYKAQSYKAWCFLCTTQRMYYGPKIVRSKRAAQLQEAWGRTTNKMLQFSTQLQRTSWHLPKAPERHLLSRGAYGQCSLLILGWFAIFKKLFKILNRTSRWPWPLYSFPLLIQQATRGTCSDTTDWLQGTALGPLFLVNNNFCHSVTLHGLFAGSKVEEGARDSPQVCMYSVFANP